MIDIIKLLYYYLNSDLFSLSYCFNSCDVLERNLYTGIGEIVLKTSSFGIMGNHYNRHRLYSTLNVGGGFLFI